MHKHYYQETNYTCGPAVLKIALEAHGIRKSEKVLKKMLKTHTVSGTKASAFLPVLEKFKLRYVVGRKGNLTEVEELLKKQYSVIVGYFIPHWNTGHFAIVKKIDATRIHLIDPYLGPKHTLKKSYFEKLWKRGFRYNKEISWFLAIKQP